MFQKEMAYRVYVTDSLFYQAQDKMVNVRYSDILDKKPADTRSGDEIARDVILRAGLVVE